MFWKSWVQMYCCTNFSDVREDYDQASMCTVQPWLIEHAVCECTYSAAALLPTNERTHHSHTLWRLNSWYDYFDRFYGKRDGFKSGKSLINKTYLKEVVEAVI